MPVIEVNGKSVELDEDGFIVNLEEWNEVSVSLSVQEPMWR